MTLRSGLRWHFQSHHSTWRPSALRLPGLHDGARDPRMILRINCCLGWAENTFPCTALNKTTLNFVSFILLMITSSALIRNRNYTLVAKGDSTTEHLVPVKLKQTIKVSLASAANLFNQIYCRLLSFLQVL